MNAVQLLFFSSSSIAFFSTSPSTSPPPAFEAYMVFGTLVTLTGTCVFLSNVKAVTGLQERADSPFSGIQHRDISRTLSTGSDYLAAAARTRIRYGFTDASDTLSVGMHRRASRPDVNVTASFGSDIYELVYHTNVSIGTPAQTFLMAVDTGFPDIWIAAPCDVFDCPTGFPLYNSSKSSTAVNKSTGEISLNLNQNLQGFIFTDTIRMGSYSISDAAFLSLGPDSPVPVPLPCSGSIGLGFAPIAQTTNLPFWRAILEGKDISAPEFSIWLSHNGGAITFGGVNNSLFSGDIDYLDLAETNSTYWALDIAAVTVQGKSVNISKNRLAVFDTASAFIFAPQADMDAIWAAVPGSTLNGTEGLYQFPCNTDLNITISFGGRTWPISSTALNLGPVSPGSQQCFGAIVTSATSRDSYAKPTVDWVVGVPFLTSVYSVFRQTPPSLGFAELSSLAGGGGPPSSSTPTSSSISSLPSATSSSNAGGRELHPRKQNTGAIAGGVIAGLIALLLAAVGLFLWRRRRNPKTLQVTPFSVPLGDEESMAVRSDPYAITQFPSSFTGQMVSTRSGEKTTAMPPVR
ncbi:Acid protease [Mycena venus]|uniref:Acid protease n=1 Tax=Mycena venus TaxID=2733690 RepID=A0A8H6Y298_9AGAR|nr:Acid protease [Mycena venus]